MLLPDWTLQIIIDHVFSNVLEQSGISDRLRSKLGFEPLQRAFREALRKAADQFEKRYPHWAASLFNSTFLEKEGVPILAQFMLRNGQPDPSQLAICWANSLNIQPGAHRNTLIRELEPAAVDFLDYLAQALKEEPELRELNDSRVLERLANTLEAIRQKLGAGQATPGTWRDYLRWLIERNLYLDPRGTFQTQRQIQLKLDDVYVSLRAQLEETLSMADRRLFEQEQATLAEKIAITDLPAEEIEDQQEQLLARLESRLSTINDRPGAILELSETVILHNRLVILGDPGSGKTTLLRYLALKHAQADLNEQAEVGNDLGATRFPILIRIADYAEYGMQNGKSLSEFLADYCSMYECPKAGLSDLLATELARGNCLILLDGLDEIVSSDERRSVVQRIEDFVRRYDNHLNHFIITSRIAGYRTAPLGEPFAHYTVQEMDDEQILRFLKGWCPAVEAAQTPELALETREIVAKREIDSIMKAVKTSPGVYRLAANPLLLRILALIHRTGAQLPQKRIELYRLAADTLARTWRTAQGVPESALIKDEYLTPLLSKLAYWLHVNKPTGIATEREVYDVLGEEWAKLNDLSWKADGPNLKIREEVSKFLVAVREHTGLFVERAPKRYGFMHLTFEEYYAARYLVARSKTRAKLLRQHLHDFRWDEPILLALGFIGLESSMEASELLETAILAQGEDAKELHFTPSPYEDLLARDYLFALRCLGDNIPAHPKLVRQLVKRMADELLYRTGSARFQRYLQALEEKLEYLKGSEGATMLLPLLISALDNSVPDIRFRATTSLGRLGLTTPEVLTALVNTMRHDTAPNVRSAAARSLGRLGVNSPGVLIELINSIRLDPVPNVSSAAARSLGELGESSAEVLTALINAIFRDSPPVRTAAARSLGELGDPSPEVLTALIKVLRNDADSYVCKAAARSLGELGDPSPQVLAALINALHSNNQDVRTVAAQSLEKLSHSSPQALKALIKALRSDSLDVRIAAAKSLGELGQTTSEVITALVNALYSDSLIVRTAAARSLGELGQAFPEVVKALINALNSNSFEVRILAARSLWKAGQAFPETVTVLVKALHDPHSEVRIASVISLEKLSQTSPEAISALSNALHNAHLDVRYQAAQSLATSGQASPEVITVLLNALRYTQSHLIRRNSALLLGQTGQNDEQTIQALRRGVQDKYDDVCTACAQALAQLGQRFPASTETIAMNLVQSIEELAFDKLNSTSRRSAHDYPFNGLWQLVVSGALEGK